MPWTHTRTVIVYRREHTDREYIRPRTFNRHQVKGCWYTAARFYMVPIEHAEEVGSAIIAAGHRRSPGSMPEWYAHFEKQYESLRKSKAQVSEDAPPKDEDS